MGILSRSTSLIRYRVRGEIEGNFWDAVSAGVKKGAYRKPGSPGELVGQGFVSQSDFTDYAFTGSDYVHGRYVVLGFRTDRARISSRILEMELRAQTKKILEESGTSKKRLASGYRRELRQSIKDKLYSQPFPAVSIQVNDLVWDTVEGLLYFTSTSQKAREELERWFKHCFGLTLTPMIPYLCGAELVNRKTVDEVLEDMDFLAILREKAVLGRDFLKWLWFRADRNGGGVALPDRNPVVVMLMDRLILIEPDMGKKDQVIVRGELSEHREGVAALRENKQLEEMRLCIRAGGDDYEMTINAPWLTMSGLRLPIVLQEQDIEGTDDGELLLRIDQVETAWSLVDALFREFVTIRTSDQWGATELPAMQKWVEEAA